MTDPTTANLPRFLCDVDGVLADFIAGALPIIEQVTGTRYTVEDFPTWDLFDVVPAEFKTACYDAFKQPGFCASLAPFSGIKAGIKQLKQIADVRIVTSPIHGAHWYFERVEWVERHVRIHPERLVFRFEKEFEDGDFLLDDHPRTVERWAKRHPNGLAMLWNQPCNARDDLPARIGNVERVSSWEEVLTYVGRLGSP